MAEDSCEFIIEASLGVILIVFFAYFSTVLENSEFSTFFDGNFDSISFSTELYFCPCSNNNFS